MDIFYALFQGLANIGEWLVTPLFTLKLEWVPIDWVKSLSGDVTPLFLISTSGLILVITLWGVKLFLKWW